MKLSYFLAHLGGIFNKGTTTLQGWFHRLTHAKLTHPRDVREVSSPPPQKALPADSENLENDNSLEKSNSNENDEQPTLDQSNHNPLHEPTSVVHIEEPEVSKNSSASNIDVDFTPKDDNTISAPSKIGGRRKTPSKTPVKPSNRTPRTFTPKPELICCECPGTWQWELALSVPETCDNIAEVQHNGTTLDEHDDKYHLSDFFGKLSIKYADGKVDEIALVDDKTPLIFKLPNKWNGHGRKIRGITKGHFIIVTPFGWNRWGNTPVEPDQCKSLKDCLAHFFYVKQGDAENEVGGFDEYPISLTKTGYTLYGKRIFDDSEEGELFINSPPELQPASDIVWARVGEEKEKSNGWHGENFQPANKSLGEVLNGRQGRFFIRVYNDTGDLVDSGEFRYCQDLQEIRVDDRPYTQNMLLAPPLNGHSPTMLQFVGVNMPDIHPSGKKHINKNPDNSAMIIAPHPDSDEITCSLNSETGNVDVLIKLPRIWWCLEKNDSHAGRWRDKPLIITREEFRKYAIADAVIRLLPPRFQSVYAGFSADLNREVSITDGLPLKIFIDYTEIDRPLNEDASLQIQCDDTTITLILVTADPPPLKSKPHLLEERLFPFVQRQDGSLRQGKGYSHGELQGADLNANDAVRLSIRIDKRRRSVHPINITTLRDYKSRG